MTIKDIKLFNFRNYKSVSQELLPNINLVLGENAQGKTNFLEAVFFLSCAKSFHAKAERELVLFGENAARIEANVSTLERDMNLRIDLSTTAKRKIFVNGIPQKKLLEYVGTVQTVVFSPDDLCIIKEGPAVRRRFIDIAISQLKPNYIQTLSEYKHILEQKNVLLKNENMPDRMKILDIFNERLAAAGAVLIKYRSEFINNLSNYAKIIHNEMSSGREELSLKYITDRFVEDPNADVRQIANQLMQHIEERCETEIALQGSLVGPHKDELEVLIDEKPAKFFASQGQIRTAVLSLKMAERDVFHKTTGELPILLLDDVLSELDENRQAYLLNKISHGQVIISSCHNHLFSNTSDTCVFEVKAGEITKTNCLI